MNERLPSHVAAQPLPFTAQVEGAGGGRRIADSAPARETWEAAQALIASRQNVPPKRLFAPGPTARELDELLALAAAAPDHGMLTPWRFVLVPEPARSRLAQVFASALLDRDPEATPAQVDMARQKAFRGPLLLVAVARLGPMAPDTPALERMVSLGAAIQNMLLGALAMGFASGLTSGRAMESPRMRELLQLAEGEHAVCCINIGTADRAKRRERPRPAPSEFLSVLGDAGRADGDAHFTPA